MADNSKIEWTKHTFNTHWGCVKVGPECDNCYAEKWAVRVGYSETGHQFPIWGKDSRRRFFDDKHWAEPLKWHSSAKKAGERHRVFCSSMADVFEDREDLKPVRERLWPLIEHTEHLDWMLLTKRPQNICKMIPQRWHDEHVGNVWYGASVGVENSKWRIDALREVPAAVRFLSCEPLLEDIGTLDLTGIHLVIAGGESGPHARPMHPDWARSLRDQCVAAGVAFHFKQNGEFVSVSEVAGPGAHHYFPDGTTVRRVGKVMAGRTLDGRTWDEMPR